MTRRGSRETVSTLRDHKSTASSVKELERLPSKAAATTNESTADTIDLSGVPKEWQEAVLKQIHTEESKPVPFFKLWRFATPLEIFLILIGLVCSSAAGLGGPLMSVFFGRLANSFVVYQQATRTVDGEALEAAIRLVKHDVKIQVLGLTGIGLARFICIYGYMFSFVYTGEHITRRIRERYLESVLRQNVAFHDVIGPGSITTRITSDTHLMQVGISDKIPICASLSTQFVAGFVIAIVTNWRIGLACSSAVPLIVGSGMGIDIFTAKYRKRMLDKLSEASSLVEEVISSIRNTHALGNQQRVAEKYDIANKETLRMGQTCASFSGTGMGTIMFIDASVYALAFYYGTTLLLKGQGNAGEIVTAMFAVLMGSFALASIAPHLQAFSHARGAAAHLYSVIDRVPSIDALSTAGQRPTEVQGNIELRNVSFVYPARPSVQVLFNFSAVFPSGKTTALVGSSGSGKSTIVSLLERFYDPVEGDVMVDGRRVSDLNVTWLRSQIGLVGQEPVLFGASIFTNISHGLIGTQYEHISDDEQWERVIEAAKTANAHDFVSALPQGYNTLIGERGMLLSGGQRQRISLARAIVGDPPILILDEATSALDTKSEVLVQEALDRASRNRTTVSIAHRLSTIKKADQIIVMSKGRQVESAMSDETGTAHEQLLRDAEGAYTRLVTAQGLKEQIADRLETAEPTIEPETVFTIEEKDEPLSPISEKAFMVELKHSATRQTEISPASKSEDKAEPHYSFAYLFGRMLRMNSDHKKLLVCAALASIAAGLNSPIFAIIFGNAIGTFSQTGDALRHGGDRYALYSFLIGISMLVVTTLQFGISTWSGEVLSRKLRLEVFRATIRQDIAFHDKEENSTGALTSSVSGLAQKINGLFGVTLSAIIQACVTLLVGPIVGIVYSWRVGLVGLACVPLTLAAGLARLHVVTNKDKRTKSAHEKAAQQACESAAAIRTVASLTREKDCCRIYHEELEGPAQMAKRAAVWANLAYALAQSFPILVMALVFWYGSTQLLAGTVTTGNYFVAFTAIVMGSIETGHVFNFVPDMSSARGAAAKAVQLLDARPEIDAQEPVGDVLDAEKVRGHVKLDNVHFRYPTRLDTPVLQGLSIEAKPGEYVALVGASGSGKSTVIGLIERFYDVSRGKVQFDGHEVSSLNVQEYRKNLALVSQEPTLYSGTIRENILMGATKSENEVTQEEIEQAAKDANIHDFIVSLPDGYETLVGGKGTQLSGGQRQRCCIARALLRNPKLLLLDESTSALDSESEKVVQQALDKAAKGRTTIAIAHRLSTIQGADRIYVIGEGKVVEQGTHLQLLASKGAYYELVQQQSLNK